MEYFAARMMTAAIDQYQAGLRDVENVDLAVFYSGPAVPASAAVDGLAAANSLLNDVDARLLTATEYAEQAGRPSTAFFVNVLEASGIEREYTTELTTETRAATANLGARTEFLAVKLGTTTTVDHLAEPDVISLADADAYVRTKLGGTRDYIRRLLQPARS